MGLEKNLKFFDRQVKAGSDTPPGVFYKDLEDNKSQVTTDETEHQEGPTH